MWRPGWVHLGPAAQVGAVRPHVEGPAWVMDSLWSATRDLVLERVDLVVALDHWRQTFSLDSIIAWHHRSFGKRQQQIAAMCAAPDGPPVLRLTDPRATETWLHSLKRARAS